MAEDKKKKTTKTTKKKTTPSRARAKKVVSVKKSTTKKPATKKKPTTKKTVAKKTIKKKTTRTRKKNVVSTTTQQSVIMSQPIRDIVVPNTVSSEPPIEVQALNAPQRITRKQKPKPTILEHLFSTVVLLSLGVIALVCVYSMNLIAHDSIDAQSDIPVVTPSPFTTTQTYYLLPGKLTLNYNNTLLPQAVGNNKVTWATEDKTAQLSLDVYPYTQNSLLSWLNDNPLNYEQIAVEQPVTAVKALEGIKLKAKQDTNSVDVLIFPYNGYVVQLTLIKTPNADFTSAQWFAQIIASVQKK